MLPSPLNAPGWVALLAFALLFTVVGWIWYRQRQSLRARDRWKAGHSDRTDRYAARHLGSGRYSIEEFENFQARMDAMDRPRRGRKLVGPLALLVVAFVGMGCNGPIGSNCDESSPDRCGEIRTSAPMLPSQNLVANVPIAPELHRRNEGSAIDGNGLCVSSAMNTALNALGQKALGDRIFEAAKYDPEGGGSYPEKFDRLMKKAAPGLKYSHYQGNDYGVLTRLSAMKLPIPVTMGTGSLYGYQTVSHMVAGQHFDKRWAAIADNNDPGKTYWMPAAEFQRRWKIPAGFGWAIGIEPPWHWKLGLTGKGMAAGVLGVFGLMALASPGSNHDAPVQYAA